MFFFLFCYFVMFLKLLMLIMLKYAFFQIFLQHKLICVLGSLFDRKPDQLMYMCEKNVKKRS